MTEGKNLSKDMRSAGEPAWESPFKEPERSEWSCQLFGGDLMGIEWRPIKGEVPNFFWRWMQYICFGNKWVKDKEIIT